MIYNLDSNDHDLDIAAKTLGFIVIDNAKVKRSESGQLDKWWGIPNPYGGLGIWIWVEYKTETGILSPSQEQRIEDCQLAGLPVEVVRSTADVEAVYHKYLRIMKVNSEL